jgi:hypothetical protein
MAAYTVKVDTREGDGARGIYPFVPTREQVLEGIRTSTDAVSIARLVAVVKAAHNWPTYIVRRLVELSRDDSRLIGKITFDIVRGK